MLKWLRRIRAAIVMGFIWAVGWSAVGSVSRWVFGVNTDAPLPLVFGVFGFLAGVIFSGVIVLTEGRRRFDQISPWRFAFWGAVGGVLLSIGFAEVVSLGWGDWLGLAATLGVACAVCAAGSLAVARHAERRELADAPDRR